MSGLKNNTTTIETILQMVNDLPSAGVDYEVITLTSNIANAAETYALFPTMAATNEDTLFYRKNGLRHDANEIIAVLVDGLGRFAWVRYARNVSGSQISSEYDTVALAGDEFYKVVFT